MFKVKALMVVAIMGLQTAFASTPVPCRGQAVSAVAELYSQPNLEAPEVRLSIFSSVDEGERVKHYVKVVEGQAGYGIQTVILRRSDCKVLEIN